jgi:hypothetical protein
VAVIIIRAGTTYRGVKYAHDTERELPDEVAQRILREGTARPVPMRDSDRADAAALAQAFRQMHQAAVTIDQVLSRNDRLNEAVPTKWPLPMSAAEFAAACEAMVEHYQRLAAA